MTKKMVIHRPQLAPRRWARGIHQIVGIDQTVPVSTGILLSIADHPLHQFFIPRISPVVAIATSGTAIVQKQQGDLEGRLGGVGRIVVTSCHVIA